MGKARGKRSELHSFIPHNSVFRMAEILGPAEEAVFNTHSSMILINRDGNFTLGAHKQESY